MSCHNRIFILYTSIYKHTYIYELNVGSPIKSQFSTIKIENLICHVRIKASAFKNSSGATFQR